MIWLYLLVSVDLYLGYNLYSGVHHIASLVSKLLDNAVEAVEYSSSTRNL